MSERYKFTSRGDGWAVMARKGSGAATNVATIPIDGCPSHMVEMRVYLVLKTSGGR